MDSQQAQFKSNSNETFEDIIQDTSISQDNTEQQYQYNPLQMSQTIKGGINQIKILKEPNNKKKNHLSNSQRAELQDQKRAQLQSANSQKQYKPIQQQPPNNLQQLQKNKINHVQIQQQQVVKNISNVPVPKQPFKKSLTNNNFYYCDDDDILYQYHKQDGPQIDIEDMVELKVQAQYDYCKLKKSESQILPAMVSIITKDIEQYAKNNSQIEAGIDLICVIDKSGSMDGQKILSVKQSLKQLLDFLSEKDRLCLIVFDQFAQRLTPLKTITKENKKYFKDVLAKISAGGSTNIAAGTQLAFQQIQQRRMKNQVTSIFLLSDGQDFGAAELIQQQKSKINDIVTIHSFGYGSDHDATLMSNICKIGQGSFYYIENVKLLDEFFADALGRLSSALAEQIQIEIRCTPSIIYEDIKIEKTYGDMWQSIEKHKHYLITLPQIASDSKKDFVFEIALPPFTQQIQDENRVLLVIQVQLRFSNTFTKQNYKKVSALYLKLYNEDEQIEDNDHIEDVTREFLRVQATDAIDQARIKCEESKNEEAEDMLEKIKQNILTDQKLAKVSAQAILDINQAQNASKRKNYNNFGMKQMCQMSVNNYQQEGLNAQFDFQGKQIQQLEKGMFQNKKQLKMVKEVQKNKF